MATEPHANPSRDPANDGSLVGMAQQILDKFLQGIDDMLPARVVAYDRASNRAQVVPLVRVLTTDNRQVGRAAVASVPVFRFGAGDMVLSFQLKPGDLGWLKANDRDISLVLQSGSESAPNSLRKHSFQDAMFFPDAMRDVTIDGEDTDNAVLQTFDGTVRIALWQDKVKITTPDSTVTIGGGGVTIESSAIDITGPTTITGPLTVAGAINTTGGVSIDGIPFGSHKHTGVQTGSGTSGGPTA
jgi:phage baseplate assembly protein gpV